MFLCSSNFSLASGLEDVNDHINTMDIDGIVRHLRYNTVNSRQLILCNK